MSDFDSIDYEKEAERMRNDLRKKKKKRKKKLTPGQKVAGAIGKFFIVLITTIIILFVFLFGVLMTLFHGPSESAKVILTSSLNETSALKWVPGLFLSDEEVQSILASNAMKEIEDGQVSDTSLIHVEEADKGEEAIEIIDITGSTYRGKMMIIKDPSKVFLGTLDEYFQGDGKVVADYADDYNAKGYNIIGGVNGGEFVDAGSYSYSAMPIGTVISEGTVRYDDSAHNEVITGFTSDNILVVGNMSTEEAVAMGLRDCVNTKSTTGPALVIDGEAMTVPDTSVYGGGYNPRTAIGQRADGAVILVAIDGRQADSLGATFKDLAYLMLEYGAVNAAAMDGGTSTQMYYNGEVINDPYSPTGPRRCPTCWLVTQ